MLAWQLYECDDDDYDDDNSSNNFSAIMSQKKLTILIYSLTVCLSISDYNSRLPRTFHGLQHEQQQKSLSDKKVLQLQTPRNISDPWPTARRHLAGSNVPQKLSRNLNSRDGVTGQSLVSPATVI